ncbi:MAG: hypothetical protein ABIJ96_10670 [Elusimicrobiota bacterium]
MEQPPDPPRRPFGGVPEPQKDEDRKGGGIIIPGGPGAQQGVFAKLFSAFAAHKLAIGGAVLAAAVAGGAGVIHIRQQQIAAQKKKNIEFTERRERPHTTSVMDALRTPAPEDMSGRRSSIGFAAAAEDKDAYLRTPGGAAGRAQPGPEEGPGASTGGTSFSGGTQASGRQPPRGGQLKSKFSGGRQFGGLTGGKFNVFQRRNKRLKKDRPGSGAYGNDGAAEQDADARRFMDDQLAKTKSKLAGKNLGSKVKTAKSIGQLKYADSRSRRGDERRNMTAQAAYSRQAFSQTAGDADDIEPAGPEEGGSTGDGGAPSGPAVEEGAYSVQKGRHIDGQGGDRPLCPPGMVAVRSGGCEPVNTGGDDATTYDALVRKAWSYIRKARSATKMLNLMRASDLAAKAEDLGRRIRTEYGQDMQGDIIKYWADRSNELNHYHLAEKRARKKKSAQMDPKLDEDVNRAARESRDSGYQE